MKKVPTIFLREWPNPGRVTMKRNPLTSWVFAGEGRVTCKIDGLACLVRDGVFYKRKEILPGKRPPKNFRAVDRDITTGKLYGWVPVALSPENKNHMEAWNRIVKARVMPADGTYELVGPLVQGNPHEFKEHALLRHGHIMLNPGILEERFKNPLYVTLKDDLELFMYEGIVWHHPDEIRMAKIKRTDFGFPWPMVAPEPALSDDNSQEKEA